MQQNDDFDCCAGDADLQYYASALPADGQPGWALVEMVLVVAGREQGLQVVLPVSNCQSMALSNLCHGRWFVWSSAEANH